MRKSAVAGLFYPFDSSELRKVINKFLNKAKATEKEFRAFVVPHAGYIYSGQVAAYVYKNIPSDTNKVIILAPCHAGYFEGASVCTEDYETPLGTIKVDKNIVNDLLKIDEINYIPSAHVSEHSIEVQLPFLQEILADFRIVPILLGRIDTSKLAKILINVMSHRTIILVSSDLSHYKNYEEAVRTDKKTIENILKLRAKDIKSEDACGSKGIITLLHVAEKLKWKANLLEYKNSGDITGDKSRVVGYCAVGFYEKEQ